MPSEKIREIVDKLAGEGCNFFVESDQATGDPRIDLAHESLIRNWPLLSRWVEDERRARERYLALVRRAADWRRGEAALLHGTDLVGADRWWREAAPTPSWADRYSASDDYRLAADYLAASRRRRAARAGLIAAAATLILGATVGAMIQWYRAEALAIEARDQARLAVARLWIEKDPTTAGLVLALMERPDNVPGALKTIFEALANPPTVAAVDAAGFPLDAAFTPEGPLVLTTTLDGSLKVSRADGSGESVVLARDELVDSSPFQAELSSDGQRLAAVSLDQHAWVSRTDGTGTPFVVGGEGILSVAFSPEGTWVAAQATEPEATTWVRRADGTGEPVGLRGAFASFSNDGRRLATISDRVEIWTTDRPVEPTVLPGPAGRMRMAVLSPDGDRVLTVSVDGQVLLWKSDATGVPIALGGLIPSIDLARFTPDGQRILLASEDGALRIWDPAYADEPMFGRAFLLGNVGGVPRSVDLSPDGGRVLTASDDGKVRIWSPGTTTDLWMGRGHNEPVVLRGHGTAVSRAVFSPDGLRVLSASFDGTARLWDASDGGALAVFGEGEGSVHSASLSPEGRRVLVVAGDGSASIRNIDGAGELTVFASPGSGVRSAAFSRDGDRVVTVAADGTLRIWRADGAGEPIVLRSPDSEAWDAAFSSDGGRLLVSLADGAVRIWNTDGSRGATILAGHEDEIETTAFSPDGTRLLTASADGTVRIWSTSGSLDPIVLRGHDRKVFDAAFSPDGTRAVTASLDGTARVWRADGTGQPIVLSHPDGDRVLLATFSPDGQSVLTATDLDVRLWNADGSGAPVVFHHEVRVWSTAFSPDGRQVAATLDDGTVRIWRSDGSDEPVVLRGHHAAVRSAAFSAEGHRLLTVSDDGTARVRSLDPAELLAKLRSRTSLCLEPDFLRRSLGESPEEIRHYTEVCESRTPGSSSQGRRSGGELLDHQGLLERGTHGGFDDDQNGCQGFGGQASARGVAVGRRRMPQGRNASRSSMPRSTPAPGTLGSIG